MNLLTYELMLKDEQKEIVDRIQRVLAGLSYSEATFILDYLKFKIAKASVIVQPHKEA